MSVIVAWFVAMAVGLMAMTAVTIPTWLFASMNRGALWRIRDCVFDARRTGTLPDSDAVTLLLDRAERFIQVVPNITAAQIWFVSRRTTPLHPARQRGQRPSSQLPPGTVEYAAQLFDILDMELERAVIRQQLLCSWSGLLLVAPRRMDAVRWVLRRRPFPLEDACRWAVTKPEDGNADTAEDEDAPLSRDVVAIAEEIVAEVYRSIAPSSKPDLTRTPA